MSTIQHRMRTIICLALIATMLLIAGCTSSPDTGTVKPVSFDTPILRFAVTSDVHIRPALLSMSSHERLAQFYTTAYAYSESQTDYNKLDGMFFVGDYSNNGTKNQQTDFFSYLNENTKEGTVARAVLGNHEYHATGDFSLKSREETAKNFLEYSGYDAVDAHLLIGGYHFILLSLDMYMGSTDNTSTYFSDEKIAWLKNELDAAVADDPKKPVFVFQHAPAQNTVRKSSKGDYSLKELLSHYPQVIDFAGHIHSPIADPKAIWQGSFTALSTGSLAYLSLPIIGQTEQAKEVDENGNWVTQSYPDGVRNGGMYYIVEVDKNHSVRILTYNIFTESLWGEPYYIDSLDPKDFRYTDDREKNAVKPTFDANAVPEILTAGSNKLQIAIPQAQCKDLVQSYRIEVYQGDALEQTIYRLSGVYYGDAMPKQVKADINGLQSKTEYTIKVYASSSWGLDSDPITLKVTTE